MGSTHPSSPRGGREGKVQDHDMEDEDSDEQQTVQTEMTYDSDMEDRNEGAQQINQDEMESDYESDDSLASDPEQPSESASRRHPQYGQLRPVGTGNRTSLVTKLTPGNRPYRVTKSTPGKKSRRETTSTTRRKPIEDEDRRVRNSLLLY